MRAGIAASLRPRPTTTGSWVCAARKPFFGKDRTFKTKRQPLGVSLAATPNPIRIGSSTTLSGVLSGTGNSGRQVQLQANPWPYTQGFLAVGNNVVTSATGGFAFTLLSVSVNTQYRVLMPAKPAVDEPDRRASARPTRSRGTRRSGADPSAAGSTSGARSGPRSTARPWSSRSSAAATGSTSARRSARHTSKGYSRYSKRIRQKHGGRYRVVVLDARAPTRRAVSKSIKRRHLRF